MNVRLLLDGPSGSPEEAAYGKDEAYVDQRCGAPFQANDPCWLAIPLFLYCTVVVVVQVVVVEIVWLMGVTVGSLMYYVYYHFPLYHVVVLQG